jgi:hypothetical protein
MAHEKSATRKNILILGSARHGKDTLAELLNQCYDLSFISSSQMANSLFIYDHLKRKYNYNSSEECFKDRVNHREEWYKLICDYNQSDKSRLAKDIIFNYDCYVGMRDLEEFNASKDLFNLIIWVDASNRVNTHDPTLYIGKNQADMIIENNDTLEDFKRKVRRIFQNIGMAN